MSTVLVTGGSGFIGGHCILQLLAAGHEVRTTVRNLQREAEVRAVLDKAGADTKERLRFFAADLENDKGWAEAVAGCEYVLHVASPFPPGVPKDENELIVPAREGALRALRASRDAGVKRVVLTSSFAAIGYGRDIPKPTPYDETDWTDPVGADVSPYVKSKTLAERAAWDFMAKEGRGMELAVVNPVAVLGPVLSRDLSTSILIVQRMMKGMPGVPNLYFGVVDVRDVADLHLRAMVHPAAKGERFLAVAGDFMSMLQIAQVLRSRLGAAGRKAPTRQLPDWLVRLASMFDPAVKLALPELGKPKNGTNAKARRLLGWEPRSNEEAVVAAAQSLVQIEFANR
ncbi:MAG: aldehyde reductase [Nevskia sp.]|nr:aldehyde reductase [Nevskia sp.]